MDGKLKMLTTLSIIGGKTLLEQDEIYKYQKSERGYKVQVPNKYTSKGNQRWVTLKEEDVDRLFNLLNQ